jgi:hypothetical protein
MDSVLATEPTETPEEKPAQEPKPVAAPALPLETWEANPRMRHIPSVEWMIRKIDVDLRTRVEKSLTPILGLSSDDPRRVRTDEELRNLCKALDRLSEVARHGRHNGHGDLPHRIEAAFDDAVENLRSLDAGVIGRRFPFHTGERSKSEPLYGALLAVMKLVDRIIPLARDIEPDIDERLLEGLVVLENPVDERMLQPIA